MSKGTRTKTIRKIDSGYKPSNNPPAPVPPMRLNKGWYRFTMNDGSGKRTFKGRVVDKTKCFYVIETYRGYKTTVHRYAIGIDVQAVSV